MAGEHRSYPRHPVQCPVTVVLPDADMPYRATSINLSRTSIQIECDDELVAGLGRQKKLPYACRLQFSLPWNEARFDIEAQMVTQRRLAQRQYVLVLVLVHEDAEQENLLETLLYRKQPIGLDD